MMNAFLLPGLLSLVWLTLFTSSELIAAERPNIVFLLADDLGSYDVGWRGSPIRTPHLDALAASGAKLDCHYVQPVCSPTRAALMTGRYPFRYGFQVGVVRPWAMYGLPLEERTLPSALREAGYETAIVGKWHLGEFQRDYLPTKRGFDHQYGHYNGAIDYFTHMRDGGFDWHRDDQVNRDEGYSTELIGREAAARVTKRNKAKPLFLYVPFNGVHTPLQAPDKYSEMYPDMKARRKTYAGMVTALDDAVGVVVEVLKSEGILDNTLIIFSSDNGGPNPGQLTRNGPLRAGKGSVYEGGVRVCAFAAWRGHIAPGSSISEPIHITDWYPTLLTLTGASLEQSLPIDGKNALAVLTKGARTTREEFVLNLAPQRGAIRIGAWKLVVNGPGTDRDDDEEPSPAGNAKGKKGTKAATSGDSFELFDLSNDLSEKTNLADSQPDRVKAMKARYDQLASEAVAPKSRPKPKGFKSPAVWGE